MRPWLVHGRIAARHAGAGRGAQGGLRLRRAAARCSWWEKARAPSGRCTPGRSIRASPRSPRKAAWRRYYRSRTDRYMHTVAIFRRGVLPALRPAAGGGAHRSAPADAGGAGGCNEARAAGGGGKGELSRGRGSVQPGGRRGQVQDRALESLNKGEAGGPGRGVLVEQFSRDLQKYHLRGQAETPAPPNQTCIFIATDGMFAGQGGAGVSACPRRWYFYRCLGFACPIRWNVSSSWVRRNRLSHQAHWANSLAGSCRIQGRPA